MEIQKDNIQHIFEQYPQIKLGYLFGSHATGKTGPLSDYDFAVYLEEKDAQKRFALRLHLMHELTKEVKTDHVEVLLF